MTTVKELSPQTVFEGLALSIGGTPLLAIQCNFRGNRRTVYTKAEHLNLTGSIKDRVALHVLRTAYKAGTIQPGYGIAHVSGENTGIAFSAIGRALGHPVTVFMPTWMSEERKSLFQRFGATVVPASHERGGLLGCIAEADEMAEHEGNVFLTHQSPDSAKCEVHEKSTGPEIWCQLKARELTPDAFVAGVGTGGTVMGVGRFLRSKDPSVRVHALEAMELQTLSPGEMIGKHRIHGLSDEAAPEFLDLEFLDSAIQVSDGDAIRMARALENWLGLGVGISSGANFLGALLVQEDLGPDAVVATVFPDDNKKYSSTDLCWEEPIGHDFVSSEVELLSYDTLRNSCRTCGDLDECQQWINYPG
jgi:cysteine synthase A